MAVPLSGIRCRAVGLLPALLGSTPPSAWRCTAVEALKGSTHDSDRSPSNEPLYKWSVPSTRRFLLLRPPVGSCPARKSRAQAGAKRERARRRGTAPSNLPPPHRSGDRRGHSDASIIAFLRTKASIAHTMRLPSGGNPRCCFQKEVIQQRVNGVKRSCSGSPGMRMRPQHSGRHAVRCAFPA